MIEKDTLDCLVRFHDIRRLFELERCIFSLAGQSYRPINIVLLLQRFTTEEIDLVQQALEPYNRAFQGVSLTIHNYQEAEPRDARTALLNLGLTVTTGRYLAFLDYDDVLFPEAYTLLTERLHDGDAAIAFASVLLMQAHVYDKFLHNEKYVANFRFSGEKLIDLFHRNFCPIHSYVIDRKKLPEGFLHFDSSLVIEEDYDLLLRLCAGYESDFSLQGTNIGIYYFKTDGSNTVAVHSHDAELQNTYKEVCVRIEKRRQTTFLSPAVQKQLGKKVFCQELSIRDLLNNGKP